MNEIGQCKTNRYPGSYIQCSDKNNVSNKTSDIISQQNESLIDKDYSNSISAYAHPQIKKERPCSLDDYVQNLIKQGKVKNKDFKISRTEKYDNYNLYIFDKLGRENKVIYWCNGNDINYYSGYDKTKYYKNSYKIKTNNSYTSLNKLKYSMDTYVYNKGKSFTEDNLEFNTTPENYINNLKSEGKNFDIDTHTFGDNQEYQSLTINEYDKNDNKMKRTLWYNLNSELQFVSRSIYDNNEKEIKRIDFNNNNTVDVCNYLE